MSAHLHTKQHRAYPRPPTMVACDPSTLYVHTAAPHSTQWLEIGGPQQCRIIRWGTRTTRTTATALGEAALQNALTEDDPTATTAGRWSWPTQGTTMVCNRDVDV